MIKIKFFSTAFFLLTGYLSFAQAPFYFTGYGRVLVLKSQYDEGSNFVKNDTSSAKRSLAGNFVFDLGINVKPSDALKANIVLRVNNQFGGFFSTGSALEFRQVQVQGVLAKKVLYNIGDIDLGMTKYTLFNPYEATRSSFEAEAFKIKRAVVDYDNFNNGNKWRVQGVQLGSKVTFEKIIREISFSFFGSRIKPSNFLTTPDRLLYGGSIKINQSKWLELGANFIGISDVEGTVKDSVVNYNNRILTGDYKITYATRSINFILQGEVGTSYYEMHKPSISKTVKANDAFFDAGLSIKHKYIPVKILAAYRFIGPEFYSPGAQTRRINDDQKATLLNSGLGDGTARTPDILDRASDLNLYNRALSTTLLYYLPMYNNALPYGAATPNRKGISLDAEYGNSDSLLYANAKTQLLSEVIGVGISQKRFFVLFNAGGTFNINKLFKSKRLLAVSSGIHYENTTGSKAAKIDLSSYLLDFSITVETLKKLDWILGVKYLKAWGSENIILRDDFNSISSYSFYTVDNTQGVYTTGLRYRFSNQIFFSANVFLQGNENKINSNENYSISQYFFSYIMKF